MGSFDNLPNRQAWEEALKDLTEKYKQQPSMRDISWTAQTVCLRSQILTWLGTPSWKLLCLCTYENDQDTRESKYQEYYAKAMTLYSQLEQAFSFYEPEFMEISEEQYAAFLEAQLKLQVYKHFLTSSCKRKTMFFRNVRKIACWSRRNLWFC